MSLLRRQQVAVVLVLGSHFSLLIAVVLVLITFSIKVFTSHSIQR